MTGVKIPDNLFIVAVVPVGEEGPVEAKCSHWVITFKERQGCRRGLVRIRNIGKYRCTLADQYGLG